MHVFLGVAISRSFSQISKQASEYARYRPFSKMAAENSNKSKLKTYTSTRKNTFSLVILQGFSNSGVISAQKLKNLETCRFTKVKVFFLVLVYVLNFS